MSTAGEKVPVVCPSCNKRLLVPATSLGKHGRCPACHNVFPLEQIWEAEAVIPAANDFGSGFGNSSDAWSAPASSFGSPSNQLLSNQGDDDDRDYQLQPAANNFAANSYSSTLNSPYASPQVSAVPSYQTPAPAKGQFWDSSVLGGIALMVIAVVWFFGGLALNIIFIYPPILFIIGLVVLVKGIFAGSLAGR